MILLRFLLPRFWVIAVGMSECWPLDTEAHSILFLYDLYTEVGGGQLFKLTRRSILGSELRVLWERVRLYESRERAESSSWRSESEQWRLSALDKFVLDKQKHIVTTCALYGAKIKAYRPKSAMLCSRFWFDLCDDSCSILCSPGWRGGEWSLLLMTPSATKQALIITTICKAKYLDIFRNWFLWIFNFWLTGAPEAGQCLTWAWLLPRDCEIVGSGW